jgi:lysozyme
MVGVVQAHPRKVAAGGAAAAAAAILAISTPMIQTYEGTITATYVDPTGTLTACTGHTGPELRPHQHYTAEQCGRMLDADQRRILRRIGDCTHVAVPVESFAAFESFAFNAGSGWYCKSFAPLVNDGDLAGACRHLSVFVYSKNQKLPGLTRRRTAERALCERGLT